MKRISQAVVIGFLILSAIPILGDILTLKNGELVIGTFEGGSTQMIQFRTRDGDLRSIEIGKVQRIQFGNEPGESSQPYLIPSGSRIVIRTSDAINSEKQKVGEEFHAALDEPIILDGVEIVPRAAEVRGRITDVGESTRIAGAAELSLELTQLTVKGLQYAISTTEYSDTSGRAGEPVVRSGVGAGVGAPVGAITAGGGKEVVVAAGAGAAAATPVQLVTKGEKIFVPMGTRLIFTLRTPLAIARK